MWNRRDYYSSDYRSMPPRGERYVRDYDRGMRRQPPPQMYGSDYNPRRARGYGGDYWWLGEHEMRMRGQLGPYDESYRRFSERSHPRFSPVGGMYPPVGGRYASEGPPRPLRDDTWFSDWTRWF